ncbi:MAG: flagellar basal body-associated FliL family protein [Nitrospirae bacterium]|nr:flagellar basal body-associated FliL family protein [Nitrospirota bacterium]
MAEEEPAKDEAAPEPKKGGGGLKKILIIVPAALVGVGVLAGGGMFAYKKFMAQKAEPADVIKEMGPTYDLEPVIANLGDESGDRFAKLKLVFELSDAAMVEELEKRKPKIQQIINLTLRSKTARELNTSTGIGLFSEEILHQVNAILTGEHTIREVYVTEIAVQ